jgi:hypothetical protein
LERIRRRSPGFEVKGRTIDGPSPPSVFVGRYGYPKITVGPLAPPIPIPLPGRLESQSRLYEMDMETIYSLRSSLYRGRHKLNVKMAKETGNPGSEPLVEVEGHLYPHERKILDSVKGVAISSGSMDLEMTSERDLSGLADISTSDSITMPMGPSIDLSRVRIIDNAKVERVVERIVDDTDVKATTAALELYGSGISTAHLVRLMSVGMLGEGKRRKLVPTRWAITAMDDALSMDLIERSRDFTPLDHYKLYKGSRFGNHFLIAIYPPPYRYEMLEQWKSGSLWGGGRILHDSEGPRGRKGYASEITGAYYAARLSVLEHLHGLRRSAGATVVRWITEDYWAPLGVWVIRETVRRALQEKPETFRDMSSMRTRIDELSGIRGWEKRSRYLSGPRDTRLEDFI